MLDMNIICITYKYMPDVDEYEFCQKDCIDWMYA